MIEEKTEVPNSERRRLERQAKAIEIVKAVRPKDHPEHPDMIALRESILPYTQLEGEDANAPGLVYFLYCGGYIKIGYTTDIKQRLNDFYTHSPMPVTLLLTIRGCPEDEQNYHQVFEQDRIRREWFCLSLDLREFLNDHFAYGTFELLADAEDEARELFESATEYHTEVEEDLSSWAA